MAPTKKVKSWIVRDGEGRIFGPFSTEQVLAEIDRNFFLGGESVAPYPGGDWIPISKAPEFYDRLLDVLADEVKATPKPSSRATSAPEDRSGGHSGDRASPRSSTGASPTRPTEPSIRGETRNTNAQPTRSRNQITTPSELVQANQGTSTGDARADELTRSSGGGDIELEDLSALNRIKQFKLSRTPLAIIGAVLALVVVMMLLPEGAIGEKRIHLLRSRRNQANVPAAKFKDKFRRAIESFQLDTFDGYKRAENELVEIVEGASNAAEDAPLKAQYVAFLCLTYRELWPFAFQDAADLRAVAEATQDAKKVDPGGLHGSTCELVNMLLNGRVREAQGLSEAVLIEKSQSAVLFEIRGDVFATMKDDTNAANYFGQARALWPGWQKSSVEEGRARAQLKQYSEAEQLYRSVIAKVPNHGVAKIELGLIEALNFNQFDKGADLISSGVGERVTRPVASRGYVGLAQIFLRKQQQSRAREAAKKAYELDPTSAEAKSLLESLGGNIKVTRGEVDLMYIGEQYMRAGDFYSAQAQFRAAFDANNRNGMAAMKAAKCLWELNQSNEAIEWMRKAIRADSKLVSAYVELADYYAQRFDYFSAMEVLKQAQGVQPNGFEVLRGFATVEFRRNNFKGAVSYGLRALKLYETDIETLLLLARSFNGMQQFSEAQKYAARAIDLDYNNTEAHSVFAKSEAGLHGVDAGASYVQQMINKYVITQGHNVPQGAVDLRITLGEIYMQDDRHKQAEDVYRQAVTLEPNSKKALVGLGKVLQSDNQTAQALEYLLKAAVLDPSDADPIFASGLLYADIGKYAEAQKQFERVLMINPRFPKAHTALGRLAVKRGDAKKALEEAMQERTMNPELPDSYILAAEAYFALKQYSNCAAEYQRAVAKAGQGVPILVRMARCYRLSGSIEAAQSLLRQATTIESGHPDIYKEQGAIYHVRGLADEAIAAYDTYIRLAPNAADRAEVEARIRKAQAGDMNLTD
jgi:tetratricopeptide (TPR) repeat protein